MKKTPICPLCGGPHYKTFCFKNPKRKQAIKQKYSAFKSGRIPRKDKLLHETKNLDRRCLILELDKYYSWYVRVKASDKNGIAGCYTCGKRMPYKCLDNGHFVSRRFCGTRFDLDNMRPQCQNCNRLLNGNLTYYREKLIREIGDERVEALNQKKNNKISTPELEQMLEDIKVKFKKLLDEKKQSV